MIHQVEIHSRAEIASLRFLREVCQRVFEMAAPDLAENLTKAAHEALSNAFEATIFAGDCLDKDITLKLHIDEEYVEIIIIDDAADLPVDWKDPLRENLSRDHIRRQSQQSLPLLHHLVDEIWQHNDNDGRHVFGMRKKR